LTPPVVVASQGIKFSAAEDGKEAVDLFEAAQGAVSLILMDVQMPIMVSFLEVRKYFLGVLP
jgi:CheY-like chemotaxis protein